MSSDPLSGNRSQTTGNNNVVGSNNTVIYNLNQPVSSPGSPVYQILTPPKLFIGRECERRDLKEALLRGDICLLCGLGGMGKTALALQVCQEMASDEEFPDGILWISLESGPSSETVANWILNALGFEIKGNVLSMLANVLNQRYPLLVLDNAESAPRTADEILTHRGKSSVLITSRSDSVGNLIPDIFLQDLESLSDAEAIALLRSRLGKTGIDDIHAVEINRLVGGLPLALVLAASFITRVLRRDPHPVTTYLERLRSNPREALKAGDQRENNVWVAWDLSWRRLDGTARQVITCLAMIPDDSVDQKALTAVLEMEPDVVQDALWTLSGFSLVEANIDSRYHLHPLLALYVKEQTSEADFISLRQKFTGYYFEYAVQGNKKNQYGEHLDTERDNVLGAMAWAWEMRDWHNVIAFAEAIDFYLQLRGYSKTRGERAGWRLEAARQLQNRQEEATALWCLGNVELDLAEYGTARERYEEALPIYQAIEDCLGEANALRSLGDVHYMLTEYGAAQERYEKALPIYRALGNCLGEAHALKSLGNVHLDLAEYTAARERYAESLSIYQAIGDRLGEANVIRSFGEIHLKQTEYAEAQRDLTAALSIYQTINERVGIANSLCELGNVARCQQQWENAAQFYEQSLEMCREIGERYGEANTIAMQGRLATAQGDGDGARKLFNEALMIFQEINAKSDMTEVQGWLIELSAETR